MILQTSNFTTISPCAPPLNGRRIVFLCDRLAVLNGAVTEYTIPLNKFFVPIDTFNGQNIVLQKASIKELDFCGIGSAGKVKFVFILPTFADKQLQSDRIFYWSKAPITVEGTQGPQSVQLEYDWKPVGNLLVFSGNGDELVDTIWLKNENDEFDIQLTVLTAY